MRYDFEKVVVYLFFTECIFDVFAKVSRNMFFEAVPQCKDMFIFYIAPFHGACIYSILAPGL